MKVCILSTLPRCDVCEMQAEVKEARYDAATVLGGRWAFLCPKHYLIWRKYEHLGTGKGQLLVSLEVMKKMNDLAENELNDLAENDPESSNERVRAAAQYVIQKMEDEGFAAEDPKYTEVLYGAVYLRLGGRQLKLFSKLREAGMEVNDIENFIGVCEMLAK